MMNIFRGVGADLARIVIACAFLATVSESRADPVVSSSISSPDEVIYRDIWREYEVRFRHGRWSSGATVNSVQHAIRLKEGYAQDGLAGEVRDCSTADYLCLKQLGAVLAIPRSGLSDKQIYYVAGAKFTVVECQHVENGICGLAMVIGECWLKADEPSDYCVKPTSGGVTPTYLYFLHSRSVGITAMGGGLSPDKLPSRADRMAVTTQEILASPYGLLRLAPEYR
jgi:hypothetical protein